MVICQYISGDAFVSVSVNYKNEFVHGHVGLGMVEKPYECDESQNGVLGPVAILYQE